MVIGYYDGNYVREEHNGKPYYETVPKDNHDKQDKGAFTAEEVKEKQEGSMSVVSYEELVKQDIDFSKYSTVVDKFFALLEE